jgi:polyhydroxyalkanoate synthesis regulator protein
MPVLVKRYGGGRLYDTAHLRYVSVVQLRGWVAAGIAFSVIDAQTGADVTQVLLA